MKHVLINASNLRFGGGVQVASSFINDLMTLDNCIDAFVTIIVSDEVCSNLIYLENENLKIINFSEISIFNKFKFCFFNRFDCVFTVFGPSYYLFRTKFHLTGFALPWMIYRDNEIFLKYSFFKKMKVRLFHFLKKSFLELNDGYVVEAMHVKKKLSEYLKLGTRDVHIVSNCCSDVFLKKECWEKVEYNKKEGFYYISYISRDYSHKNIDILPYVAKELIKSGIFVKFLVTLTKSEYESKTKDFKIHCDNVGLLKLNQCPSLYDISDAVIFPSYLECFSAMPIEAMVMKKPLFASDRYFVKEFCGQYPFYFEPSSFLSIANSIKDNEKVLGKVMDNSTVSSRYFSSLSRTKEYLKIIERVI